MDYNTNINTNINTPIDYTSTTDPTASPGTGFFGAFNWTTWLIIILIFAFLGFNIFVYLAKGTQDITGLFNQMLQKIVGTPPTNTSTNTSTDNTPQGATAKGSLKSQPVQQNPQNVMEKNSLNQALNAAHEKKEKHEDYEADHAKSSVHGNKSGWCYIGEDRGYRSCVKVGDDDKCMSGDIFPTNELCVNPNLRA